MTDYNQLDNYKETTNQNLITAFIAHISVVEIKPGHAILLSTTSYLSKISVILKKKESTVLFLSQTPFTGIAHTTAFCDKQLNSAYG